MVGSNIKFLLFNAKGNYIIHTGKVIDKIVVKQNTAYLVSYIDVDVLVIRVINPDQITNLIQ
jgi:hypothetical protein